MTVLRSLTALAVLIVSLVASVDAQAGGHGRHGGRAYGSHGMHAGPAQSARFVHVRSVRSHPAIAYAARPYTAASYAPRVHHGYAGYGGGRVVRYASPVQQVRYVRYQPTVYHQAAYSTMSRHAGAHHSRRLCTC
jgi:hypothetical protein